MGIYEGYIGIMAKKMDATIEGLGFRILGFRVWHAASGFLNPKSISHNLLFFGSVWISGPFFLPTVDVRVKLTWALGLRAFRGSQLALY